MNEQDRKHLIRHLNRATTEAAIQNADEVEFRTVQCGSATIEHGIHDEIVTGSIREQEMVESMRAPDVGDDSEVAGPDVSWMRLGAAEEEVTGRIADEVKRRSWLLGENYPFTIVSNSLVYRRAETGFYEFCLAASSLKAHPPRVQNTIERAFERFAKDVLVAWLGLGADGWQTGFPGRSEAGLPAKLSELWQFINQSTQEWQWSPNWNVLPKDADKKQKDLGVDVLTWKPLRDEHAGNLFYAGQCACGEDALEGKKSGDLDQKWLRKWLTLPDVEIVPCLFLSRCLSGSARAERVRSGVLWFDRIRLMLAAVSDPQRVSRAAQKPYHELASLVFEC